VRTTSSGYRKRFVSRTKGEQGDTPMSWKPSSCRKRTKFARALLAFALAILFVGAHSVLFPAVSVATAPSEPEKKEVKVWVNTHSGVYHCPGTHWYGNTKQGQYMSECEAQKHGYRPAYGRSCGSDCNESQKAAPRTDSSPPSGATAQCRDGTYSFSQHRSGTCSHHGGVSRWLTH
jgi:hypothetical protein